MPLSISQPSMLPERCVLFLTNAFSGGPIEAVPVGLRARFRVLPLSSTTGSGATGSGTTGSGATAGTAGASSWGSPSATPAPEPPVKDAILGVLATDHVGYASWDLSPLIRRFRLELDIAQTTMGNGASIQIDSLTIRLAGPLTTEIDALDPAQLGGNTFVRLYATDPATLFQLDKGTFPSVQSPSL